MEGNEVVQCNDSIESLKEKNQALEREIERLRNERQLANEIFADTLCKYENEMSTLRNDISHKDHTGKDERKENGKNGFDSNINYPLSSSDIQSSDAIKDTYYMSESSGLVDFKHADIIYATADNALQCQRSSIANKMKDWAKKTHIMESKLTGQQLAYRSVGRQTGISSWKSVLFNRETRSSNSFSRNSSTRTSKRIDDSGSSDDEKSIFKTFKFGKGLKSFRYSKSDGKLDSSQDSESEGTKISEEWIDNILPEWNKFVKSKYFKRLLRKGVPHDLRGEVWKKAIGNRLHLTPEIYDMFVKRAHHLRTILMKTSRKYRDCISNYTSIEDGTDNNYDDTVTCPSHIYHSSDATNAASDGSVVDNESVVGNYEINEPESATIDKAQPNTPDMHKDITDLKKYNNRCKNCGCFMWESELFASFQAISVDLHRTFPKFDSSSRSSAISFVVQGDTQGDKHTNSVDLTQENNSDTTSQRSTPQKEAPNGAPFGVLSTHVMQEYLRSVLEAYSMLRPDLGYVQGMPFVVGTLLLYMDEYSAFVCFSNLLLRRSLHAFYTFQGVEVYFRAFDILLDEFIPTVSTHFKMIGIQTDTFLVEWMYTLFTRCLPFEILGRVWDLFVVEGDPILFQTALAVIAYFKSLIENSSFDECMELLSSSSTSHFADINQEKFLVNLHALSLTEERLDELLQLAEEDIRSRQK